MNKRISEIFDYGDEIAVPAADDLFAADEIKEITMNKIHENSAMRHAGRTVRLLLIAAAVVSILTVSALAVGLSVHRHNQAQLRQELQIENVHVQSYTEYAVPETDSPKGVTILSVMNDGDFQRVYLDIAPVTRQEAEYLFFYSIDGGKTWGGAFQHGAKTLPHGLYLDDAYDEQTQTLTLWCHIPTYMVPAGDPVTLTVSRVDPDTAEDDIFLENYGSASFYPAENEPHRVITFDPPVAFEMPTVRGSVVSLELGPTCAVLGIRCEVRQDSSSEPDPYAAWYSEENALDALQSAVVLTFSDGTTLPLGGEVYHDVKDGVRYSYADWLRPIDISAVTSVTINGQTVAVG